MPTWPKISVVTPSYDCHAALRRCIESVASQNYPHFEHIVVDSGSPDGTVEVLKHYPHVRVVFAEDKGRTRAINKGIRMVTGEVVCWLSADDFMMPNAMTSVGMAFAQNPTWEVIYGKTDMVAPDGTLLWTKNSIPNASIRTLARWWENTTMPHQSSMYFTKRLLDRVGPLNEDLQFSIDLELWFRCAAAARLHFIDRTLSGATERMALESESTKAEHIKSHWQVLLPFLSPLSFDERAEFWEAYYIGRLSGLKGFSHVDEPRFPDSEEALVAVVRALKVHKKSLAVLRILFPDDRALLAIVELLAARGLYFHDHELISIPDRQLQTRRSKPERAIVIDGIFFERARTGIYRLWDSLLEQWSGTAFGNRIVVLDRSGHAPRHSGIQYRLTAPADTTLLDREQHRLEEICEQENCALFVSTYYTSVRTVPSVMPVYDMIPEKTGFDLTEPDWVAKHLAIERASAFCCISHSTRNDLLELFPSIDPQFAAVAHCGIDRRRFSPACTSEVIALCQRFNLDRPYFMLVGGRAGYKNARMFFEAIRSLPSQHGFKVLMTGGVSAQELDIPATGCEIVSGTLTDEELKAAYTGALALVYPSKYEGFGLPILEAMACGCPVISSPWSSLPEVGGSAALYVDDIASLSNALAEIQKPGTRRLLTAAGYEQVKKFTWSSMALKVQDLFEQVIRSNSIVSAQIRQR